MSKHPTDFFAPPVWLQADQARRLSQALLLEGAPDGLAADWSEQLLRLWLCRAEQERACGVCPSCRLLAAGTHPDYLELSPQGSKALGIDAIREGLEFLAFAPQLGSVRVLRILAAEQMRTAAANALLKGLEEPPPRARILLLSSAPARVLPTIRSRCQRLPMPAAAAAACAAYLRASGLSEDAAAVLAQRYAERPDYALAVSESALWAEVQQTRQQLLAPQVQSAVVWELATQWSKDEERVGLLRDLMLDLHAEIFRLLHNVGTVQTEFPKRILVRSEDAIWEDYQAWLRLAQEQRQNLQISMRMERLLWRWFFGGEQS
ncbi:MAG: DNA polymerase III subunit delta' [Candidatus Igneacidithiobacillus chanchocoensis]